MFYCMALRPLSIYFTYHKVSIVYPPFREEFYQIVVAAVRLPLQRETRSRLTSISVSIHLSRMGATGDTDVIVSKVETWRANWQRKATVDPVWEVRPMLSTQGTSPWPCAGQKEEQDLLLYYSQPRSDWCANERSISYWI
jgi:hypothetical protein